jgi:signal peptidase I
VATVVTLVVVAVILTATSLFVPLVGGTGTSMSPTLPACNPGTIAEGVTYHFRDPHRGEIVVIHARGHLGGPITPDPNARDLKYVKRVIGVPGDTVVGRNGQVFVNGKKADDIPTDPFPATHLGPKQYYVLGENRSFRAGQPRLRAGTTRRDLRPPRPDLLAVRAFRDAGLQQETRPAWPRGLLSPLGGA